MIKWEEFKTEREGKEKKQLTKREFRTFYDPVISAFAEIMNIVYMYVDVRP